MQVYMVTRWTHTNAVPLSTQVMIIYAHSASKAASATPLRNAASGCRLELVPPLAFALSPCCWSARPKVPLRASRPWSLARFSAG